MARMSLELLILIILILWLAGFGLGVGGGLIHLSFGGPDRCWDFVVREADASAVVILMDATSPYPLPWWELWRLAPRNARPQFRFRSNDCADAVGSSRI